MFFSLELESTFPVRQGEGLLPSMRQGHGCAHRTGADAPAGWGSGPLASGTSARSSGEEEHGRRERTGWDVWAWHRQAAYSTAISVTADGSVDSSSSQTTTRSARASKS